MSRTPRVLLRLQKQRDAVPLPKRREDLYNGDGLLRAEYQQHTLAMRILIRHWERSSRLVYKHYENFPLIVQIVRSTAPLHNQLSHREPFAVIWLTREFNGSRPMRKRKRILCTSLWDAVGKWEKLVARYPTATVVSRARGYDIPVKYRGRLPRPWKWCPYCCKPRKMERDPTGATFYANLKVWSEEKGRYIWKERQLALTRCPVCHNTNRDPIFRRSNQPWEKVRIKPGKTRLRRRRRR